jgi:hypothetical protein
VKSMSCFGSVCSRIYGFEVMFNILEHRSLLSGIKTEVSGNRLRLFFKYQTQSINALWENRLLF